VKKGFDMEKMTSLEAALNAIDGMSDLEALQCADNKVKAAYAIEALLSSEACQRETGRELAAQLIEEGKNRCRAWEEMLDAMSPLASAGEVMLHVTRAPMHAPSKMAVVLDFNRRSDKAYRSAA